MRTRRIPIGWPRCDPRHYRFPIPNVVWEYKLKPIEFVLLSYLCCLHSRKSDWVEITTGAVATAVNLTVGTAKKHLATLKSAEIITEHNTLSPKFLSASEGNFFSLPNEIFLLKLPPSAFMVYAYLLLIEDRRTHTCHPSYNTIAATTGMCRNTVIKSIGVLLNKGLIEAEHSHYLDQHGLKWNGNNLYTILSTQRAVDKFHQKQLDQLELEAARRRVRKRQEKYDLRHPRATCIPPAPGVPDPTPAL